MFPTVWEYFKVGTTNNPLSTGTFYKIRVDKSGIFKITNSFYRITELTLLL
jgi:hypothetical protein